MMQNNMGGFQPQPQVQNIGYNQPMQPQPQIQAQQNPNDLKDGDGTVIEVLPKLNPDGSQKQGQTAKGDFWQLYKIRVQSQNGTPSFSFFKKANNNLPQMGQPIMFRYSEKPNPQGGSPMKTMVGFKSGNTMPQQQGMPQTQPQQPQQAFNQNQTQTPTQQNSVQNQAYDAQMAQWIQQAKSQGAAEQQKAEVLGAYLLQYMTTTKTVSMFNQLWGQQ